MEGDGLSVVRSLVGHGIGRSMHEDPQIPNYGDPGRGPLLEEGMVLAVEPMVNAGRHGVRMGDDGWAIYSQDGSLAAHFEFTIAITAEGPRILTPWHLENGELAVAARGGGVRTASPREGSAPGRDRSWSSSARTAWDYYRFPGAIRRSSGTSALAEPRAPRPPLTPFPR